MLSSQGKSSSALDPVLFFFIPFPPTLTGVKSKVTVETAQLKSYTHWCHGSHLGLIYGLNHAFNRVIISIPFHCLSHSTPADNPLRCQSSQRRPPSRSLLGQARGFGSSGSQHLSVHLFLSRTLDTSSSRGGSHTSSARARDGRRRKRTPVDSGSNLASLGQPSWDSLRFSG